MDHHNGTVFLQKITRTNLRELTVLLKYCFMMRRVVFAESKNCQIIILEKLSRCFVIFYMQNLLVHWVSTRHSKSMEGKGFFSLKNYKRFAITNKPKGSVRGRGVWNFFFSEWHSFWISPVKKRISEWWSNFLSWDTHFLGLGTGDILGDQPPNYSNLKDDQIKHSHPPSFESSQLINPFNFGPQFSWIIFSCFFFWRKSRTFFNVPE